MSTTATIAAPRSFLMSLSSLGRLLFGGLLELAPDGPAHSGKRLPLTIEAGGGRQMGVTSGGHQSGDPRTGRATGQIVRIRTRSSSATGTLRRCAATFRSLDPARLPRSRGTRGRSRRLTKLRGRFDGLALAVSLHHRHVGGGHGRRVAEPTHVISRSGTHPHRTQPPRDTCSRT